MNKKIIVAAILAAVTGTASAATLHEAEGVKVDVKGAVNIHLKKAAVANSKTDVDLDDGALKFNATYDLPNNVKALAYYQLDMEGEGTVGTGDIYAGLESSLGTVKVGRLATLFDDVGAEKSYEFSNVSVGELVFPVSGSDVIKYQHTINNIKFGLATELSTSEDDASHFDGMVGYSQGVFSVDVFAIAGSKGDVDFAGQAIQGSVKVGDLDFSTGYSQRKNEEGRVKSGYTTLEFAVGYTVDQISYVGGYSKSIGKNALSDDTKSSIYTGASYKLTNNVSLMAEVAIETANKGDSEVGFETGVNLSF